MPRSLIHVNLYYDVADALYRKALQSLPSLLPGGTVSRRISHSNPFILDVFTGLAGRDTLLTGITPPPPCRLKPPGRYEIAFLSLNITGEQGG